MPQRAPYHDELASLMSQYKGRTFTAGEVKRLFEEHYPHLKVDWVQASDHCVDHICKDACHCAKTEDAIFQRPAYNTYTVI